MGKNKTGAFSAYRNTMAINPVDKIVKVYIWGRLGTATCRLTTGVLVERKTRNMIIINH